MTLSRFRLESFEPDLPAETDPLLALEPAEFEEAKLAAFEKGYTAGWDDAIAAQDAEAARLRADLGQNLQALNFTYHEARQHVLAALKPLLIDMCAKVLPVIARESIAPMVADQLTPIAENLASTPITIVANPASLPQIEALLNARDGLPLVFAAEPSLSEAQVYLRFAEEETRLDLDNVIALIGDAIRTYFQAAYQEQNHG